MEKLFFCLLWSIAPLLAQNVVLLNEHRIDDEKASMFVPVDLSAEDGIRGLRAHGAYSWVVTPVIAQTWDKKTKSIALAIEARGLKSSTSTIVIIVDGKPATFSDLNWEIDSRGAPCVFIEREDLIRTMATAQNVSIAVFGDSSVAGVFHPADLSYIQAVVSMYDANNINSLSPSAQAVFDAITGKMKGNSSTVAALAPSKPIKPDHNLYIESRLNEAQSMCHDQIIATAKDPYSVEFLGDYRYSSGRSIFKNWIFIYWDIMGKNTYGAVLRHSMTCTLSCPPGKACSLIGFDDQGG